MARGSRGYRLHHKPGFDHLSDGEVSRMSALLKRQLFLQNRIKAGESHGAEMNFDKAEEAALSWAIEWIRSTRKGCCRGEEE